MQKAYSLEESYDKLDNISKPFLKFIDKTLEQTNTNQFNIIGIGNSISAGWTAIDNNVCPWLEKLKPFIDKNNTSHLPINFATFSIAGKNSNEQIYQFLTQNPTLDEVKKHFSIIFDEWKQIFDNTPFENYVNKEKALLFYPGGSKRLKDFYGQDIFTLTNFFGNTGEFLNHPENIFSKEKRKRIFEKEILYLQKIISYIQKSSQNSYMTVGNFPYIAKHIPYLNSLIQTINNQVKLCAAQDEKVRYFDKMYIDLIIKYKGKFKIDNHPTLEWQYTALYLYINWILQQESWIRERKRGC